MEALNKQLSRVTADYDDLKIENSEIRNRVSLLEEGDRKRDMVIEKLQREIGQLTLMVINDKNKRS